MKQTEIGLIPEDWEVKELANIVDKDRKIRYGVVQPGTFDRNGILLIRGQDYSFGWSTEDKFFKISPEVDAKYINARVQADDLLLTIVGNGTGNLAIIPKWIKKANITQTTARIVADKSIAKNKYIYYYLGSQFGKNEVKNYVKGAAQPGLNICDVEKFKIILPPLAEQEAIAAALSDADAWIESLEQLIAKKRLIKQGAMQTLLTPKDDWEVKKLGEVCDVRGGGTPSTFTPEFWNGNVFWFTPTEVGNTKYLYKSVRKITELGLKNSSANILPVNTILLTSRAGIGDLGILKVEACTNQGFQSLVCKDNVNYEFVYYMMQTKKNELLSNASGSTFLEISPNKVKSISFDIPSLSEQERIARILSDIDAELEALEQQLAKARQIKQGMMQELLTGRTRLV